MTDHGSLPEGLELQRTTDEFTAETVPRGLLRAHRIADGVWGRLRVRAGSVRFIEEVEPEQVTELGEGDTKVITPGLPHRVEPDDEARFAIEFHR